MRRLALVGLALVGVLGFALAGGIGWRWSLAVFVGIEGAMLAWIRDSLLLNVLMLFHPVEAVKQWQMAR